LFLFALQWLAPPLEVWLPLLRVGLLVPVPAGAPPVPMPEEDPVPTPDGPPMPADGAVVDAEPVPLAPDVPPVVPGPPVPLPRSQPVDARVPIAKAAAATSAECFRISRLLSSGPLKWADHLHG